MKKKLTPPNKRRCQAMKPNGRSFMSMGGVGKLIRCTNKPVVIAIEKEKGIDGKIGSMSLCEDCMKVCKKDMPGMAIYNPINK